MAEPFFVKDCALIAQATGLKAQSLKDLRDALQIAPLSSLYFHFWGSRLGAQYDPPEYHNEIANWVYRVMHDVPLAEKLALLDPKDYTDLEGLRNELVNCLDERIDELEILPWCSRLHQFHFMSSSIVVFNTPLSIREPSELAKKVENFSTSTIFYHFIDARRRTEESTDDISEWLKGFGTQYTPLIDSINSIDPYFSSLNEIKQQLMQTISAFASNVTPNGDNHA